MGGSRTIEEEEEGGGSRTEDEVGRRRDKEEDGKEGEREAGSRQEEEGGRERGERQRREWEEQGGLTYTRRISTPSRNQETCSPRNTPTRSYQGVQFARTSFSANPLDFSCPMYLKKSDNEQLQNERFDRLLPFHLKEGLNEF